MVFIIFRNIVEVLINPNAKNLPGKYEGYSSCPLFVGKNELILAEFKYDGVVDETFFNDQEKPRKIFYHMKKYLFPLMYWKLVPRGLWNGRKGIKFSA
jgi:sulfide:quinone oxidoreductase